MWQGDNWHQSKEPGVARQTLYQHISPAGELRPDRKKLLNQLWVRVASALHF